MTATSTCWWSVLERGPDAAAQRYEGRALDYAAARRHREKPLGDWREGDSGGRRTFGFASYKVFEFVTGSQHVVSPRAVALALASLGNLSLLLAAVQHRLSLQSMRALGLNAPHSAAAILAGFLSLLGIVVLVVVILRL